MDVVGMVIRVVRSVDEEFASVLDSASDRNSWLYDNGQSFADKLAVFCNERTGMQVVFSDSQWLEVRDFLATRGWVRVWHHPDGRRAWWGSWEYTG